jgi:3-hydroxyisobutyrate dehydrogenase-like beta-hydroxyacid dehydrogenase
MTKIGYVGLGDMGSRMVKRLLDAGHSVVGWNRTASKAQWLLDSGMAWGESPRAVAEACDIIFSMVTNTQAVNAITQGDQGVIAGLIPGKIYVDMSTMSPNYSRELAQQVAQTGATMLDAPVSGSIATLESGKLSIMVGGDEAAYEQVLPVLMVIGPTVHYVGGNGTAVGMKIATNLGLAVQMMAFSESVLLAEKSGIPREKAVEVLLASVTASPMVKYRGPFVLGHPEGKAWFDCQMMQKDLLLALEMGRDLDVPLPTTATANEFMSAGRAMGMGDYDFSIVFDVLAKMSGIETDRMAQAEAEKRDAR